MGWSVQVTGQPVQGKQKRVAFKNARGRTHHHLARQITGETCPEPGADLLTTLNDATHSKGLVRMVIGPKAFGFQQKAGKS